MQKISPCRIVFYRQSESAQPWPFLISDIHPNDIVDGYVFGRLGVEHMTFIPPVGDPAAYPAWDWPVKEPSQLERSIAGHLTEFPDNQSSESPTPAEQHAADNQTTADVLLHETMSDLVTHAETGEAKFTVESAGENKQLILTIALPLVQAIIAALIQRLTGQMPAPPVVAVPVVSQPVMVTESMTGPIPAIPAHTSPDGLSEWVTLWADRVGHDISREMGLAGSLELELKSWLATHLDIIFGVLPTVPAASPVSNGAVAHETVQDILPLIITGDTGDIRGILETHILRALDKVNPRLAAIPVNADQATAG